MSYYSGMTFAVTAGAFDAVTKLPVSEPTCTVNFYAPPKNPRLNPTDRVADYSFAGVYDPNQKAYVAVVTTTGWVGGNWYYQAVFDNSPNTAWEYAQFTLLP